MWVTSDSRRVAADRAGPGEQAHLPGTIQGSRTRQTGRTGRGWAPGLHLNKKRGEKKKVDRPWTYFQSTGVGAGGGAGAGGWGRW